MSKRNRRAEKVKRRAARRPLCSVCGDTDVVWSDPDAAPYRGMCAEHLAYAVASLFGRDPLPPPSLGTIIGRTYVARVGAAAVAELGSTTLLPSRCHLRPMSEAQARKAETDLPEALRGDRKAYRCTWGDHWHFGIAAPNAAGLSRLDIEESMRRAAERAGVCQRERLTQSQARRREANTPRHLRGPSRVYECGDHWHYALPPERAEAV